MDWGMNEPGIGLQTGIRFSDYPEVPTRKKPGLEPILGSDS